MKKNKVYLSSILFVLLSIIVTTPLSGWWGLARKNPDDDSKLLDYEVLSIRFFEGGLEAPTTSERIYKDSFDKEITRYVYTELKIKNLQYKADTHQHDVIWLYYNPDGTLSGRIQKNFIVNQTWVTAWTAGGWGWREPGKWPVGIYRVELFIDGVKIRDQNFTIKGFGKTPTIYTPTKPTPRKEAKLHINVKSNTGFPIQGATVYYCFFDHYYKPDQNDCPLLYSIDGEEEYDLKTITNSNGYVAISPPDNRILWKKPPKGTGAGYKYKQHWYQIFVTCPGFYNSSKTPIFVNYNNPEPSTTIYLIPIK